MRVDSLTGIYAEGYYRFMITDVTNDIKQICDNFVKKNGFENYIQDADYEGLEVLVEDTDYELVYYFDDYETIKILTHNDELYNIITDFINEHKKELINLSKNEKLRFLGDCEFLEDKDVKVFNDKIKQIDEIDK